MTLTYLHQGQLWLPMHLDGEIVKCYLKGKTCSKLANGLNDLKKEIDSKGCSDPALGLYTCVLQL